MKAQVKIDAEVGETLIRIFCEKYCPADFELPQFDCVKKEGTTNCDKCWRTALGIKGFKSLKAVPSNLYEEMHGEVSTE